MGVNSKYIFFIIMFNIFSHVFALLPNDSFSYTESWYHNDELCGQIRIQLNIIKICDNEIEILIIKDMTPFGQTLNFTAKARYEMGKYIFSSRDNWENVVFGYFIIENTGSEKIILFFDCEIFSDLGRNMARLFGETYTLTRNIN